jgi:hypothetical protein
MFLTHPFAAERFPASLYSVYSCLDEKCVKSHWQAQSIKILLLCARWALGAAF